ncbi:MAG: hypothetical protein RLZZ595_1725 [Bacteroidota bacterium]|jgi:hypothetical protein
MITVPGSMPKIILLFWTNWVYFWVSRNDLNKSIKIFINYFIGPLLFAWLSYRVYQEVKEQKDLPVYIDNLFVQLGAIKIGLLLLVVLLMFLQWMLEAKKWQLLLNGFVVVSLAKATKTIFSGIAFSIATPNRIGEFIGRILHLPKEARLQGTTCTFIGNFAQLIVTCMAGSIALFLVDADLVLQGSPAFSTTMHALKIATPVAVLFFLVLYFKTSLFFRWLLQFKFIQPWRERLVGLSAIPFATLMEVLIWSFCRYGIFMVQYWLLFELLDLPIGLMQTCIGVSVMLLWLAIIPTISMAELGLRWQFSILLFSPITTNTLGLTMAVTFVWFINMVLPAILGSLFLIGFKIQSPNQEQ